MKNETFKKDTSTNAPIPYATATEDELRYAITSSDLFQKGMSQKHHFDTTVGMHTLEVEKEALKLQRWLQKMGIETDRKRIIVASLCHDLGIINRHALYKNNYQCYRKHPGASVVETRKLISGLDKKTEDAIRYHMFPISFHVPMSKEGWVVSLADKHASIKGTLQHFFLWPKHLYN